MNPMRVFCLVACLLAAASAHRSGKSLKPSHWLSTSELEELPRLDELRFETLEEMPLEKGAKLMEKIYHISQINKELNPTFVPSPSQIPVKIYKPNQPKVETTLSNWVNKAKDIENFCTDEVTIFVTGLPMSLRPMEKSCKKMINSYMQRYAQEAELTAYKKYESRETSSEESYADKKGYKTGKNSGTLVVIELGEAINTVERMTLLDVSKTGKMFGEQLYKLAEKVCNPYTIKIVANGVATHVMGKAGREFSVMSGGLKLDSIVALEPTKIYAKNFETLVGLARGDFHKVQGIHASPYGMGTIARVGDVDFYVNGPTHGVPGAKNVIEAACRPIRYFAETVIPGNEKDFPARAVSSLKEYETNAVYGKRAYMGIDTDATIKGDYILEVNEKAPFGRRSAARPMTWFKNERSTSWRDEE